VSYKNLCHANCAEIKIISNGSCIAPCLCPDKYQPVCGENNKTYMNGKCARCARIKVASAGKCGNTCECEGTELTPVCGVDGMTYDNACYA